MVKIEEVPEKQFGLSPSDDEYTDDDESDALSVSSVADSEVSDTDPSEETLYERIVALKDIIPPDTRREISETAARTAEWVSVGAKAVGNAVWIVTTSALLVGLPLALAIEDEARLTAEEKAFLAQQAGAQQMLAPSQAPGQPTPQGLVPPGFA